MSRKFLCAALVTLFTVSIAMSGEYFGVITKVNGDKVTFQKYKGKGKDREKDGDPITLPATGAKIVKGKFDKEAMKMVAGDAIENGLKAKMFTEISEKGVNAMIVTDEGDKKITEIRTFGGKKKKKDAN